MILADPITVTIYTKPNCPGCTATKKRLDRKGIPYTEIDLADPANAADLAAIQYIGIREAPVVCANVDGREQTWSGFNPDRIDALAKAS